MSNMPSGERGVPVALLIVFIVLILLTGVWAYVLHVETQGVEGQLATAKNKLDLDQKLVNDALKTRDDLYKAAGYSSLAQIEQAFNSSTVNVDPKKLEALITKKLDKRDEIIKAIGVNPTDLDDQGQSKYLQLTIDDARRKQVIPDALKNTKVGALTAELIRRDKAIADRAAVVAQGEEALKTADQAIADKDKEIASTFKDLDEKAVKAWAERAVEQEKLRVDSPKWASERETLEARLSLEQAINQKIESRLKAQHDMASPIDGTVTSFDWKSGRGTVNLGSDDRVKPGYEFDVYMKRPGPDVAENRVYRGRIRLLNVETKASLFVTVVSPYDDPKKPIMEGNLITSQLFDSVHRKVFVLKGWFPEGGDYSKKALTQLIYHSGGVVQKDLTLDTDYLVVGVTSEEGLKDLSVEAKASIAEGAKCYEDARHYYTTILSTQKLFKYLSTEPIHTDK